MKEKCHTHPDRNALSFCHSCGKHYCEECLTDGGEYYYCKEEKCQNDKAQETSRIEVTTKENEIILKQKWKETSNNFYKKTSKILAVVWVLLTIFLFIIVPSYKIKNPIWLPLLSFIVCLKWFVLVWLIRVSVYKHFFWEKRMIRELQGE